MTRQGFRVFDADTHIIEPVEAIEAYLSAGDRARLAGMGSAVQRAPAKGGMSRYVIGKRPALDRRLGSRERVRPPTPAERGARDGGTPWDVRWQGPPFPSDRVSFDPEARVRDMDLEGVAGWTSLSDTVRQELLWDNALRCYRRYGARPEPTRGRPAAVGLD
jgi:hypothetical protein